MPPPIPCAKRATIKPTCLGLTAQAALDTKKISTATTKRRAGAETVDQRTRRQDRDRRREQERRHDPRQQRDVAQVAADRRQRGVDGQCVERGKRDDQQDRDGDETVFGREQARGRRHREFVGHASQSCRHPVVVRRRGLLRCAYALYRGFRRWLAKFCSISTVRLRSSPTTVPKSTTRSPTRQTSSCSTSFASSKVAADVRAIVWRGNGKSFSSGRDVEAIGGATRTEDISQLELMERGHRFAKTVLNMPAPVIVEMKGWSIGGSFERALLCDMRIAGESARMMLPEVKHGVIPDTGGIARLFHMAGHGVATDLALTGRVMGAAEALQHGIVSRVVADDQLQEATLEIAHEIAKAPAFTVKMARRIIKHLANDTVVGVDGRRGDRADDGVRFARLQRDEGRARRTTRAQLPPPLNLYVSGLQHDLDRARLTVGGDSKCFGRGVEREPVRDQ